MATFVGRGATGEYVGYQYVCGGVGGRGGGDVSYRWGGGYVYATGVDEGCIYICYWCGWGKGGIYIYMLPVWMRGGLEGGGGSMCATDGDSGWGGGGGFIFMILLAGAGM